MKDDRKFNTHTKRSKCDMCGKVKDHVTVVFEQFGWFRGDDEVLGRFCKEHKQEFKDKHNIKYGF